MNAQMYLHKGVTAAKDGDKPGATQYLAQAVRADPKLVEAWWWLANLLEDEEQRRYCLQRVHALDPNFALTGSISRPAGHPLPSASTSSVAGARPRTGPSLSSHSPRPAREWDRPPTSEEPRATVSAATPRMARGQERAVRRSAIPVGALALVGIFLAGVRLLGLFWILAVTPASPGAAPAAFPTLPPAWTQTAEPSPLPSPIPPATIPPPTPDLLQGNVQAALALELMQAGNYVEAVAVWDQVIEQDPANHAAYYQRALSNLEATTGETVLEVYRSRLLRAIEDLDLAVSLSDGSHGDSFAGRARAFDIMAGVAANRVDSERLFAVALENTERALELPLTTPAYFLTRSVPSLLTRLGRCEEGMELATRLNDERGGDSVAPSVALELILGELSLCLGDFPAAIAHYNFVIDRDPQCSFWYRRAESRYLKGDPSEAHLELNTIISACPSFAGYRHYLRALINQEKGATELAQSDLLLGSLNTWGRGGLLPYVESMIAFDQGDRTRGVELLRQAEMTIGGDERPFLERFQRELAALGEEPLRPTPDPFPEATPLAPLPQGLPTRVPMRTILLTDGTGPVELAPGEVLDIYVVPPKVFAFDEVVSLTLHLISNQAGSPALGVQIYRSRDRRWESVEMGWGENRLTDEDPLVNTSGDVYLRLESLGPEVVVLSNVGLAMTVRTKGGSYVGYSYLDE